jgi:nitrite reductase/ring-hydroxylating ferredoxin subunit
VPERLHTLAAPADAEGGLCPTAVPEDRVVGWRIDGFWCVLGRVGTRLFAYREICPGCGSSLVQSPVTAGVVTCSICRRRYDLTRGGRSLDMDVGGMRSAPEWVMVGDQEKSHPPTVSMKGSCSPPTLWRLTASNPASS